MKKVTFSSWLTNLSDSFFFLFLAIYQLIFLFQGFDFADEGHHATLYQQIFSHPESMVGDFMYWFSGIVGGSFYYLFPTWGLLGLRFQGLLVMLSTMSIAYFLLKRFIGLLHLRIGILMLFIFTTNEIKEMHYDTLTALLNISSAFFLFQGIKNNAYSKLLIGGAFISLSMFTRLPSIVMLSLIMAIGYFGIVNKSRLSQIIKQGLAFLTGFIFMTLFVLVIMKLIGHLQVYLEALKMVFSWGSSGEDSHNLFRLIKLFIGDYSQSIKYALEIIALLLGYNFLTNQLKSINENYSKLLKISFRIGIFLVITGLVLKHRISYSTLISVFTGISLVIASIVLFSRNFSNEVKLLVFIGCLIVFFEPLGSAGGMSTAGRHSLWLLFPFAIDFIFNLKLIDGIFNVTTKEHAFNIRIFSDLPKLNILKKFFAGISIVLCIYFSYYYPYFDMSDRIYMTSAIKSHNARGIYTTKERAKVVNELLVESSKYIKKNDHILAYDCMPMFFYLTETLPYTPNTWPWLYVPENFKEELDLAKSNSGKLPVVITQKMSTLSNNWPQNIPEKIQRTMPEQQRDSIMAEFISQNKYKSVWENEAFEIYLPQDNSNP
jgi:hypothetical protein